MTENDIFMFFEVSLYSRIAALKKNKIIFVIFY